MPIGLRCLGTVATVLLSAALGACSSPGPGGSADAAGGPRIDAARSGADAPPPLATVEDLAFGLATGSDRVPVEGINLAVDDTGVYLPTFGPSPDYLGTILQVPLAGGDPVDLASPQSSLQYVSLGDSDVYFTSYYGGDVGSVPKQGGPVSHWVEGMATPVNTALSAGVLFWNNDGDATIRKLGSNGGGENFVLADQQVSCRGLAVDADSVYLSAWGATDGAGAVRKVSKDGGTPADLVTDQVKPDNLWLDGETLYFRTADGSSIAQVSIARPGSSFVIAGADRLAGPVSDAAHVYWANQATGDILAQPKAAGGDYLVAQGQTQPFALAIHAGYLYWLTGQDRATQDLHRVPLD